MKKRVFLYVRVSTQEQAKEGYSIDEQIDRLKDYARAKGWIVVNVYVDGGYSGSNTNRPALKDMIKDVEAKKGDCVIVYKLDRLSRSQKDTLELIEDYFLTNNVDFVSMTENFDTSTPFGKAMIGILSVFAQLEREQIKERMSMGREGRAKEGKFHGGGYAPIGYDYVDSQLIINEYEAMQIREIYKLYQEGNAFHAIEKIFLDKGYTQKHGQWYSKRIRECMLNDLYIGNVHYKGQVYKGEHEPIIDEETFNNTVALYKSKDFSFCRNYGKRTYLGGIIYCKHCTARYSATSGGRGTVRHRYYACNSRRKSQRSMIKDPNCMNKNYKMDVLDNMILDEIRKLANDPSHIHRIRQEKFSDDDQTKQKLIEKEIAKIDTQKSRFMDLYGLGEFTMEEVQGKVAPLNEQKRKLEQELNALTNLNSELSEEEAFKIIESFDDVFDEGDSVQIRLLIHALIKKIEIDNDNIEIYWKFA